MKWYWFSFSFDAKNQGCCNVQGKNEREALQKTIDLGIHPKHDSIRAYELSGGAELEPDRLYSKKELIALGFQND